MLSASTGHELQRATPESQGVTSSAVLQFVEAVESQIHEIHSFMLLRHGQVIAEGWWSPYRHEHPHLIFSLSKSFTSTAVGLAIAEGHFSIDDPVLSFFPEEIPANGSDDLLVALRVRHLLTMSTGQAVDTWSAMVERPDDNWIRGFFDVPVLHVPGTHFVYNTGATYMLSAIVQQTTGMKLVDYLQPRLFAPLGIEDAVWQESPQGITAGGIGLSIKTEDIAKFGQFYLQKGMWQGRQLLSQAWVEQATSLQVSNSDGAQIDWSQGYGYQFWRCRHSAYRGDGVFGQYCIVMPEQNAILAMTGGIDIFDMQQPLNLIWDILLPAMGPDPLPKDSVAQDALSKKLLGLNLIPVQGRAESPIASQISGRTYITDGNELGIRTIAFDFTGSSYTVTIETTVGDETIPCGHNMWQQGQSTVLFKQPLLFDRTPITTSGAWTAGDIFTMVIRLYETPFYHTLVCHFIGDELLIEIRVNVSLESLKPLLLVARPV
ncbi:MAG: serine hydrolase [Anaerolineaceae bacterium]|nr:serine hydrolase [Anaerolineaceae bacterium]